MRAESRKMPSGVVVAFAGYVLYSVYVCMTFYSPTTISSVVEIGYLPKALYLFFIILGRMIALALVALVVRRRQASWSVAALVAASAACAVVGFASMALVFQLTAVVALEVLLPWFFASGVWIGLGDAFAIVLWFSFASRLGIRPMYLFLVASAVVSALLYFGTTFLPAPLPWVVALSAFFGSLVCCAVSLKRFGHGAEALSRSHDSRALRRLGRPLVGVVLMAFMAGLMMNVAGQEKISLQTYQWTAFVIMVSLNALLLLPAVFAPRAFSVPRLYKFILPLSALGFLLLPVAWDASGRGMVNSFVQVGFTFTNVIFYCLIAEEYRAKPSTPQGVFSLMQLVVMAANFAGLFLAFFCIGYLEPGDLMLTITALVAVYLILTVTLLLFKDKNLAEDGSLPEGKASRPEEAEAGRPPARAAAGESQSRVACLIDDAQLSSREREVLDHLRQGRAPKTIAKLLFVSENTVRFHIRNIYQKFDVHSRTQLMELLDDELDAAQTGTADA